MSSQNDQEDLITGINIIPLVDIALVLLIIFMVSSTLMLTPSIKVSLPKAKTGQSAPIAVISVTLTKEGALHVNGQPATLAGLQKLFGEQSANSPSVQIHADRTVPHGRVMELIDLARTAGIDRFVFMVEQETS
jgi:biopolymer transport protein ExbD